MAVAVAADEAMGSVDVGVASSEAAVAVVEEAVDAAAPTVPLVQPLPPPHPNKRAAISFFFFFFFFFAIDLLRGRLRCQVASTSSSPHSVWPLFSPNGLAIQVHCSRTLRLPPDCHYLN